MRDLDNVEEGFSKIWDDSWMPEKKIDNTPENIVRSLHEYRDTRFDNILNNLVDNKERDNETTSESGIPSTEDQ